MIVRIDFETKNIQSIRELDIEVNDTIIQIKSDKFKETIVYVDHIIKDLDLKFKSMDSIYKFDSESIECSFKKKSKLLKIKVNILKKY